MVFGQIQLVNPNHTQGPSGHGAAAAGDAFSSFLSHAGTSATDQVQSPTPKPVLKASNLQKLGAKKVPEEQPLASTLAIAILQLTHQLTAQVGPSKGGSGNPAAEQPGAATTVGADKASPAPVSPGSTTDLAANAFTGAGANPAVPLANSLLAELQSPVQPIVEKSVVSGAGASAATATPAASDTKNISGISDTMFSKATDVSTTQTGSTTISGAAANATSESAGAVAADTSQTDQTAFLAARAILETTFPESAGAAPGPAQSSLPSQNSDITVSQDAISAMRLLPQAAADQSATEAATSTQMAAPTSNGAAIAACAGMVVAGTRLEVLPLDTGNVYARSKLPANKTTAGVPTTAVAQAKTPELNHRSDAATILQSAVPATDNSKAAAAYDASSGNSGAGASEKIQPGKLAHKALEADANSPTAMSAQGQPGPPAATNAPIPEGTVKSSDSVQTAQPSTIAPTQSNSTPAGTANTDAKVPDASPIQTSPATQVHSARIIQSGDQIEMRLGLRTETFGAVQVHTTVSNKQVDVSLGSERGDLRASLSPELPALQSTLQQHGMRLEQVRALAQLTGGQADVFSGSGNRHQASQRQEPGSEAGTANAHDPAQVQDEIVSADSGPGLSIRV
jgi:hypothetical protein